VSKVYGVDRDEMVRLRAQGAELLARREDHGVIQDKVMRFFARNGRSTARRVAGALNLRLADARSAIARLVDCEKLVRDGDIWEKSVASGQRYAAAYKPTGDEG
jgi:predicted HTH transcriptional regulator